jgi:hypothetical protein
MNKTRKNGFWAAGAVLILALAFTACDNLAGSSKPMTTGSVSGFAVFNNAGDNSGIAITKENVL